MPRRLTRPLRRFTGDPLRWLAEDLPASELRSVELEVAARRAARRSPSSLLGASDRKEVQPSPLDARELDRLVAAAWDAIPALFRAVDLSPVEPLGASAALAGTPQDNVLTATRDLEVLSDPTIAFARLAAHQRRWDPERAVHLAAAPRLIRMQKLESEGHTRHFRLIALGSAGREGPSEAFVLDALRRHVDAYVSLLLAARERGYDVGGLELRVTDPAMALTLADRAGIDVHGQRWPDAQAAWDRSASPPPRDCAVPEDLLDPDRDTQLARRTQAVRDQVFAPLGQRFPELALTFDPGRLRQATYYTGLCFHIRVDGFPGGAWPIIDGGLTDWTAQILSDRKERFFGSGCGLELLVRFLQPR